MCAIDKYEEAPLKLLLQSIFQGYEITPVIIQHNSKGTQGNNFSYTHETCFFVVPQTKRIAERYVPKEERWDLNLRKVGGESARADGKNCFYPIRTKDGLVVGAGDVCRDDEHPKRVELKGEEIWIYPIDKKGVEKKWRYSRAGFERIKDIVTVKGNGQTAEIFLSKETAQWKTVWTDPLYSGTHHGTRLLTELGLQFPYPKSIHTVKDCLRTSLPKNGICLDFFAGSGTTFQAVAELNEADGGTRQCILVTNNESNICRDVTWERMKRVTTGTHDYPECTKKYDGCPSAQVAFYKMEVYDQNDIQGKLRGWKQRMEGYLPLLSFKEKLSHDWERIPGTKGFFQKNIAVVGGTETDYDTVGFLKDKKINTLWIVCDDREEFRMIKSRLPSTIRHCHQLPRGYRDHFEAFYRDEE